MSCKRRVRFKSKFNSSERLNLFKHLFLTLGVFTSLTACASTNDEQIANPAQQQEATSSRALLNPEFMDLTVDPCVDFYQYSCGGWVKNHPLPSDHSVWSTFHVLAEENLKTLKNVLDDYKQNKYIPAQADAELLGTFYDSCMNEDINDSFGRMAIRKLISKISNLQIKNKKVFAEAIAELHKMIDPHESLFFFAISADKDYKDPQQMMLANFSQGGLGLEDESYYNAKDADTLKLQKQYREHIAKVFQIAGYASSKKESEKLALSVFLFEKALASKALSAVARRRPNDLFHPMTVKSLQKLAPGFDWLSYLQALHIKTQSPEDRINVKEPAFFQNLSRLLIETQQRAPQTLRAYLVWQSLHTVASITSRELDNEDFNFFGRILMGQKEQQARWKRCLDATDNLMGEALGDAYAQLKFSPEHKKKVEEMLSMIRLSFLTEVQDLNWMDVKTKEHASLKLSHLVSKIGYPEKPRSYRELHLDRSSWYENVLQARKLNNNHYMNWIGSPIDRSAWGMTASTVNAEFDPSRNTMTFPAGILQPPFFDLKESDAANYGASGNTIGHEMTHSVDDEGKEYNHIGNLENWWSDQAYQGFKQRSQCLVDQFSKYTVAGGDHVNGELTLGENIADLGGAKLSLKAYRASHPESTARDIQEFFIGAAQNWCSNISIEAQRMRVRVDPHAPMHLRVNGLVVNMPEFAEAFQCKAGSAMTRPPAERCDIW